MNDLVQIEPVGALIFVPLPARMKVGTLAFDRIRRNYELKLPEVKRAGLLGIPIQVVAWLPPKQVVLLDEEDHVIKTFECE